MRPQSKASEAEGRLRREDGCLLTDTCRESFDKWRIAFLCMRVGSNQRVSLPYQTITGTDPNPACSERDLVLFGGEIPKVLS